MEQFLASQVSSCCRWKSQLRNICTTLFSTLNEKSTAFSSNTRQTYSSLISLSENGVYKTKDVKRFLCYKSKTLSFISCPRHCKSFHHETYSKFTNSLSSKNFFDYGPMSNIFLKRAKDILLSKQNALHGQHKRNLCSSSGSQSQALASNHSNSVNVEDQPPSWLFVSSAVAGAYGAQVNLDLDLEKKLHGEKLLALRDNVKSRRFSVDIDGLLQNLKALKQMQEQRAALVSQKEKVLQQFKFLKDTSSAANSVETKRRLGEELRAVKAEISTLKSSWDLEEKVMLEALKLPNDLHLSTPLDASTVLRELKADAKPVNVLNHIDIARKFDLIKFSNVGPKAYYLRKDLVLAEMALTSSICDFLQARGYRHISGPEFVKTPVVEGCGDDVRDGHEVLTMLDPHKAVVEPLNHLCGVSLHMFAAYVSKTCIGDSVLPLQMFGCGRRYQNNDLPGLFGALQSTQAALFSCVKEEDVERQFESCLELIWEFLQAFGFSLRLRQVCARDLCREETRRVDFEMFSPSLGQLLPVASVSDVGDFLSRRLMVTHNQNHADIRRARRLHMIHGTVLNITSMLALWMEHSHTDETKFTLCNLPHVQKSVFPPK